jgi:hypothetical protein
LFFTARRIKETYNEIKNLKIMYSIVRLTRNTGTIFDGIRTIRQFIRGCFQKKQMKIVKFGGKSLLMGRNQYRLDIIERKIKQEEKIAIVISERKRYG